MTSSADIARAPDLGNGVEKPGAEQAQDRDATAFAPEREQQAVSVADTPEPQGRDNEPAPDTQENQYEMHLEAVFERTTGLDASALEMNELCEAMQHLPQLACCEASLSELDGPAACPNEVALHQSLYLG